MYRQVKFSLTLLFTCGALFVLGAVAVAPNARAAAGAGTLNFDCVAALAQSTAAESIDLSKPYSQLDLKSVREDAVAFVRIIDACWANRKIHEAQDQFKFRKLAAGLMTKLASHRMTLNSALDEIYDFTLRLHDGHLSVSDPRSSEYFYSSLRTAEVQDQISIQRCDEAQADCIGLKLPAILESVDGVPIKKWIAKASETSSGSTSSGRYYHARRSLESWIRPSGTKLPYLDLPKIMTVRDSNGVEHSLNFSWKTDVPKWQTDEDAYPCVSAESKDGAFILKVTSFYCLQERTDEMTGGPDAALIPALEKALASAPPFEAIVLDLRGNAGGLPTASRWIVGRLTANAETFYFGTEIFRSGNGVLREVASRVPSTDRFDLEFRTKPLKILADGGCFSQCSILVQALVRSGRAKLYGTIDSGAGGPRFWRAPSAKWGAEIPIWTTLNEMGTHIEGLPVQAEPTSNLENQSWLD